MIEPKSICIVRLSALGDVLMLVPLIKTLQAQWPQCKISWVISDPAYTMIAGLYGVEFIVIPKPRTPNDYWRFKKLMNMRTFDILLATQATMRANLLYPLIKAQRKIGYDKARANDAHRCFIHESISAGCDHTLDGFLKFAQILGIRHKIISWDIPITAQIRQWAQTLLPKNTGPLLLINPAASKPERNWLVERYIEIIKYAQLNFQTQVVLIGGPGIHDKILGNAISSQVSVYNLIAKTTPKQLLALIERADLLICPDTGPSHMATAMGTSVIALHAVTNPAISGPYNHQQLVVNYYPEATRSLLGQDSKNIRWGTHVHSTNAMKLITVKAVLTKLHEILSAH